MKNFPSTTKMTSLMILIWCTADEKYSDINCEFRKFLFNLLLMKFFSIWTWTDFEGVSFLCGRWSEVFGVALFYRGMFILSLEASFFSPQTHLCELLELVWSYMNMLNLTLLVISELIGTFLNIFSRHLTLRWKKQAFCFSCWWNEFLWARMFQAKGVWL